MMQELNTEQKQRINLTLPARDLLESDRELFAPHLTHSGFINELLFRIAPISDASITETVEKQRDVLLARLEKKGLPPQTVETVLDALLTPFREELVRKASSYPNGISEVFRLNNQNRDLFYDPHWADAKYYDHKPSRYMKALIEDYASRTLYQREAFFFHEWISLAQAAAESGRLLRITSLNFKREKVTWDLRVYKVLPNDAGLYHYIVGKAVPKGGLKSDEHIASFRISRLVDVRILTSDGIRSGKLSRQEKKELDEKIARQRVQFLVGDREESVLHFTKEGKALLKTIQYMKPTVSYIDDQDNYHFECPRFQVFQYFARFGEHAQIIAPASLREDFKNWYLRAYEAYQSLPPDLPQADTEHESASEPAADA